MRGVHTFINDIRRQVFTEVARMAFEGGNYAETIRRLPHKIILARWPSTARTFWWSAP